MPAIIAVLVRLLGRLFASRIGHWIVSALLFIGISFGTQSMVVGPIMDYINGAMSGVSGDGLAWLGFFNIDRAVSIIFSAYAARAASKLILRRRAVAAPVGP